MKNKRITLVKIDGKENPSDILTKPSSVQEVSRRFEGRVGFAIGKKAEGQRG